MSPQMRAGLLRALAFEAEANRRLLFLARRADLCGDVEASLLLVRAELHTMVAQGLLQRLEGEVGALSALEAAIAIEAQAGPWPELEALAESESQGELSAWIRELQASRASLSLRLKKALDGRQNEA
jgi:hypothetical protein